MMTSPPDDLTPPLTDPPPPPAATSDPKHTSPASLEPMPTAVAPAPPSPEMALTETSGAQDSAPAPPDPDVSTYLNGTTQSERPAASDVSATTTPQESMSRGTPACVKSSTAASRNGVTPDSPRDNSTGGYPNSAAKTRPSDLSGGSGASSFNDVAGVSSGQLSPELVWGRGERPVLVATVDAVEIPQVPFEPNVRYRSSRWRRLAGLPRRIGHAVANLDCRDMIVFGGMENRLCKNDLLAFDPDSRVWTSFVPLSRREEGGLTYEMPIPREGHSLIVYQNALFVFGGNDGKQKRLNDVWRFDLTTEEWAKMQTVLFTPSNGTKGVQEPDHSAPPPRAWHTACVCDGRMVIYGGSKEGGSKRLGDLWALDIESQTWELLWTHAEGKSGGDSPDVRSSHTAALRGDEMFVFGGHNGHEWLYDMWAVSLRHERTSFRKIVPRGGGTAPRINGPVSTVVGDRWLVLNRREEALWQFNFGCNLWAQILLTPALLHTPYEGNLLLPRYGLRPAFKAIAASSCELILFGGADLSMTPIDKMFSIRCPALPWEVHRLQTSQLLLTQQHSELRGRYRELLETSLILLQKMQALQQIVDKQESEITDLRRQQSDVSKELVLLSCKAPRGFQTAAETVLLREVRKSLSNLH